MKKFLKNNIKLILVFLLGIVVSSGITAYAVNNYIAGQIRYQNNTFAVNNVNDALDYLYTDINKEILERLNLSSSKINYSEAYEDRISYQTTSLELEKGSYLVYVVYIATGGNQTNYNGNNPNIGIISYTNGSCTRLNGRWIRSAASELSNNVYISTNSYTSLYSCKFNDDTTVTANSNLNYTVTSNQHVSNMFLQSIKLD